ncbi:MAG: hypothetical protein V2I33_14490, partial [Kangiellaceae bacterium]|nr:hypothetical protein [Kangiellaceae bacterium]
MFLNFTKFEFNYFRKQPSFYVTMLVFFLLPFFAMISDNVQIGGSSNVDFNSPHAITQTMLIMCVIGMFLVANFVGGTAVRDVANKMDGIMLSYPTDKVSYLWGRLFGSFLFCLFVFSAVPLGTLIGTFWPTVDAERLGDTQLWPYIWSYLIFVIPNFLFCSALFYAFAIKSRSMMGMYLGVVAFFILYNISQALLDDPELIYISTLVDPFGLGAFGEATRYWTPFERNENIISLEGSLLVNRLLWLGVSLAVIVITHLTTDIRKPVTIKTGKQKKVDKTPAPTNFSLATPSVSPSIDRLKFFSRTKFEIAQIVKSAPFIILMIMAFFSLSGIYFQDDGSFGTSNWPLTRNMAAYIWQSFSLMVLIIITYYAGEAVWRERNLGIGDIIESTPIKNWSIYFPKIIALSLIIFTLMITGILFTVLYQVIKSYGNFEWGVYFSILSLQFILPMLMNTVLAVFIQVLSPNKYVGMMLFVLYIISTVVISNLGLEHNMWSFGDTPTVIYSDINQFGHYLTAAFWYNSYWLSFSMVLVVLGFSLWPRGAEYKLKHRFTLLKLASTPVVTALLFFGFFLGSGGYIYYNTRVLNDFVTQDERRDYQTEYEQKYKQYEV